MRKAKRIAALEARLEVFEACEAAERQIEAERAAERAAETHVRINTPDADSFDAFLRNGGAKQIAIAIQKATRNGLRLQ